MPYPTGYDPESPEYYEDSVDHALANILGPIAGLCMMTAYGAIGVLAFFEIGTPAATTAVGTGVTLNGIYYPGITLAEATAYEAAMVEMEEAAIAGTTLPRLPEAISAIITKSAVAGMKEGIGMMSSAELAALFDYGVGEEVPGQGPSGPWVPWVPGGDPGHGGDQGPGSYQFNNTWTHQNQTVTGDHFHFHEFIVIYR